MHRPRWYGALGFGNWREVPQGRVQVKHYPHKCEVDDLRSMPEAVLRLAHEEYDRQHPGQPYERMQERGGLGLTEIVALLADHIERLKRGA